jgi:hypothetical protein|tara:strand:+ start:111 stop:266 length:156 start_codon:yes stop_codon:yes gene_type:complete
MPFKSEKQRRYMHANLPKIAKRWEHKYKSGGPTRVAIAKNCGKLRKNGKKA